MLDKVRRAIRREGLLLPEQSVFVAVSGGVDSMVLLHVLHALRHPVSVAHVDHGLRGAESSADAAFVQEHCSDLGVPFQVRKVDVAASIRDRGGSAQMAARDLRYAWFNELGIDHPVALAHHADDAVETLFINLLRGTGSKGWGAIPWKSGKCIRPLLGVHRDEILRYAQDHSIPFREDSSNASPKYLRNRIRQELIPLLEQLRPGSSRTMARSIRMLRELETSAEQRLESLLSGIPQANDGSKQVPFTLIEDSGTPALVLHHLLRGRGSHPDTLERIHDAIIERNTGAVFSSGNCLVSVDRDHLHIGSAETERPVYVIDDGEQQGTRGPLRWAFMDGGGAKVHEHMNEALLDADRLSFPVVLRPWQAGDRMRPIGLGGSKLVSDILTDAKVPVERRSNSYVMLNGDEVVWLVGHRIAEGFQAGLDPGRVLRCSWSDE
ncbi:MAG: tRNA lysidine(34) synthetase TilS [Flavobacteriales bacterium]|nr:tRNA lysidine(34) synthetase TilS [Flavobacteriales bacterium]